MLIYEAWKILVSWETAWVEKETIEERKNADTSRKWETVENKKKTNLQIANLDNYIHTYLHSIYVLSKH